MEEQKKTADLVKEFMDRPYIPEKHEQYEQLFANKDNIEKVFQSFSRKGYDTKEERKFAEKLEIYGLQIPFLKAVIAYLEERLENQPQFSDYEKAVHYSCVAAAGLEDLSNLRQDEQSRFFDILLKGIRYAGERGDLGRAFHGKDEIRAYASFLHPEPVKRLVECNFILDADFISCNVNNGNLLFFVGQTSLAEEEKNAYRILERTFVNSCNNGVAVLMDLLEELYPSYQLNSILSSDIEKDSENEILMIRLTEEATGRQIEVWGKLEVWKGDIRFRVLSGLQNGMGIGTEEESFIVEYGIEWTSQTYEWRIVEENSSDFWVWEADGSLRESKPFAVLQSRLQSGKRMKAYAERLDRAHGIGDMQIVCFWHAPMFDGKVKEKIISVEKGIELSCTQKDHFYQFHVCAAAETDNRSWGYYLKEKEDSAVKSLNILLGKNGQGKTSTMKLLRYDGVECAEEIPAAKYFIVYKRNERFYYSTNISEEDYGIEGDGVLQKGAQNISRYRRQKNRLVYFSNVLLPYAEDEKIQEVNWLNLSSQYIRDYEIAGTPVQQFFDGAYNMTSKEKRRILAKHKQNFNKDVLRQIQFLYDSYPVREKIDYVRKYIYLRCDLSEDEIVREMVREASQREGQHIEIGATGFWEYREWQVEYHSKEELRTIIEVCKDILQDDSITYFEIVMPKMSSGENARLLLFSRLHDWIAHLSHGDFRQNQIVLLDEIEAYMHPEWQRSLIYDLIRFFEWEKECGKPIRVQLFISSNSPFLISDADVSDVIVLDDEIELKDKTFAQNIHTILKESFFMKSGSMGEYARQKIDRVYRCLMSYIEGGDYKEDFTKEEMEDIIERIGEPLLYQDLKELYAEAFETGKQDEIETDSLSEKQLEELIKRAREELERRRK